MCDGVKNCIANHPLPWKVLGGGLAITGAFYLRGKFRDFQERRCLDYKRAKRQQERKEQFENLQKMCPLTDECVKIVSLPFDELQRKLQSRELTARTVLKAYVAKALVVTKESNSVTQFVPQMWEWADELDKLPQVKGPLHGIPMAIKEDHDLVGMDTTLGLSRNLNKPATKNAVVVQILQDLGGVPFCKTNLPQTVFSVSSDNPIYGTTVNHLNKKLSPGGSSSGAGALVGAGGAIFGTGSDIGGSLRIPSHMSGICTLRPTIGRISGRGVVQCIEGSAGYVGVSGIMTKRASTLASVFRAYTANSIQNQYDPLALPIPFNDELFESKTPLRIGYFKSLSYFPTMGDTPGTILKAKEALEKLGHRVIAFELPNTFDIMEVYLGLAGADGGRQNYKKLRNDQVSEVAEKFTRGKTLLSAISEAIKLFWRGKSIREFVGNPAVQSSEVLWDYLEKQKKIRYDVFDRMDALKLDLILSPAYPFPACRVEDADILFNGAGYMCIWNLCDCPAGIVPFGKESCQKIAAYDDQNDYYLKLAKDGIKLAKDMPIGVQIIGKPYKEEMVLRVLAQLDEYKLNHG